LCVMWVRSYSHWDSPFGPLPGNRQIQINSLQGYLFVNVAENFGHWTWRTFGAGRLTDNGAGSDSMFWNFNLQNGVMAFGIVEANGKHFAVVAYWCLAMFSSAIACMPWLPWLPRRFSLRTLLIAMTLVAVVLGVVMWAVRK